jgi:hypothetical protein
MNIEKEISLINDIVLNAVVHGADSGGSYNMNEDGLRRALNAWITEKNLTDYTVQNVERTYFRGGWDVLQIVEDCI